MAERNTVWERWNRVTREEPLDIRGLAEYLNVTVDYLCGRAERYPRTWNKLKDCWEYMPSEVMKVVTRESDEIKARLAANPPLRVYAIQCVTLGLIKIGVSVEPAKRLLQLSQQSPDEMRLLGSMQGGYNEERVLHKRFAEHRQRGEWFSPHQDILAWIEECLKST